MQNIHFIYSEERDRRLMAEYERIVHPFPPFFRADSEVLILGSLPSVKSREQGFYYGHPRNRFWSMLLRIFGEQGSLESIEEKKCFLEKHRLALYDVIYSCEIRGSSDSSIRNVIPADILEIMEGSGVSRILLNGKTAAGLFRRYQSREYQDIMWELPSTSPANAAMSLEALVERWQQAVTQGTGGNLT